jgi:hypothetical protein
MKFIFFILCLIVKFVVADVLIDNALNAVAFSNTPDFAVACTLDQASAVTTTAQGSFALCSNDFQSSVNFFTTSGRQVTLVAFEDGETGLFNTNLIYTGNVCVEIYNKIGRSCFAAAAAVVAQSYLPTWLVPLNVSSATVANFIQTSFSPVVSDYPGIQGRCYYNSGHFQIFGLSATQAQNAITVRNAVYGGCEISEGDSRLWAIASWSIWPRLGAILITAGFSIVALLIPCLSCCF